MSLFIHSDETTTYILTDIIFSIKAAKERQRQKIPFFSSSPPPLPRRSYSLVAFVFDAKTLLTSGRPRAWPIAGARAGQGRRESGLRERPLDAFLLFLFLLVYLFFTLLLLHLFLFSSSVSQLPRLFIPSFITLVLCSSNTFSPSSLDPLPLPPPTLPLLKCPPVVSQYICAGCDLTCLFTGPSDLVDAAGVSRARLRDGLCILMYSFSFSLSTFSVSISLRP